MSGPVWGNAGTEVVMVGTLEGDGSVAACAGWSRPEGCCCCWCCSCCCCCWCWRSAFCACCAACNAAACCCTATICGSNAKELHAMEWEQASRLAMTSSVHASLVGHAAWHCHVALGALQTCNYAAPARLVMTTGWLRTTQRLSRQVMLALCFQKLTPPTLIAGVAWSVRCNSLWRRIYPAYEQPIVHVAQRVGHKRRGLVVPPLAVHYKLVLVITAQDKFAVVSAGA